MRDRSAFPSTRWSRILAPDGARDLDALAQAYHRPIAAYLQARLRGTGLDPADAAQEAFAWLLDKGLFAKADPARGSFRGFLKKSLANFAIELLRAASAQKRGGGKAHEPLEGAAEPADRHGQTPDEVLDAAWRRELLQRAEALLRDELQGNGRGTYYALFRDYYLAEGDEPDHQALARRYGVTRTDVSNWLDHAKRRYRAILERLVTETVTDADELQQELRWLFGEPGAGR